MGVRSEDAWISSEPVREDTYICPKQKICENTYIYIHIYPWRCGWGMWVADSYVWCDTFICVTQSYVWCGVFIRAPWRIHTCDVTHSSVWRIHMCDVTHSYVRRDAFIRVTWHIHLCDAFNIWCDTLLRIHSGEHPYNAFCTSYFPQNSPIMNSKRALWSVLCIHSRKDP